MHVGVELGDCKCFCEHIERGEGTRALFPPVTITTLLPPTERGLMV